MADCYQCVHYMEECTVIDDPYAECKYYKNRYEVNHKEIEEMAKEHTEIDQFIGCLYLATTMNNN